MSIAVGFVVVGFVAWIVVGRQSQSAREQWVLDKRYTVYERILDAASELVGHPEVRASNLPVDRPDAREPLILALHRLSLVAPDGVRHAGGVVLDGAYGAVFTEIEHRKSFIDGLNDFVDLLHDDLATEKLR